MKRILLLTSLLTGLFVFSINYQMIVLAEPIYTPIKLNENTLIYDSPNGISDGRLAPQSLIALNKVGDWYEINSYLGKRWIKPNNVVLPRQTKESINLTNRTFLYNQPTTNTNTGASLSPQRINVISEWDGWIKVSTWLGEKWMKYQPSSEDISSRISLTNRTYLYNDTWEHSKSNASLFPQTVNVKMKRGDYYLISSYLGDKWIKPVDNVNDELISVKEVASISSRKDLYLSPFEYSKDGASIAAQPVYMHAKVNGWGLIDTWLGLRWIKLDIPTPTEPPSEPITNDMINFSGYSWTVKKGDNLGPGPNLWSNSEENVWVDESGKLHLKITNRNGNWYSSEIVNNSYLGYGTYRFYLETNPKTIDANVVLGLFTYDFDSADADEKNYREIDIELSKWGNPNNLFNTQYTVQPYTNPNNFHAFDTVLEEGDWSTHSFTWEPNKISFLSLYGHYQTPPSEVHVIDSWTYTGVDVPNSSKEKVDINFWLFRGNPPLNGQEQEIVIKKFEFIPYVN